MPRLTAILEAAGRALWPLRLRLLPARTRQRSLQGQGWLRRARGDLGTRPVTEAHSDVLGAVGGWSGFTAWTTRAWSMAICSTGRLEKHGRVRWGSGIVRVDGGPNLMYSIIS